jgi:putative ABC transport system ATP-binding protein
LETPIIKLRNIEKEYVMGGETFKALDGVSLNIVKNEYIAITGPSGSGKSTLMNVIGCLDTPTRGHYYLKNEMVKDMNETELAHQRNKSVGFIFQNFNLIPRVSALANVMQPLVYRFISASERKERALEALIRVGLKDKIYHTPSQLSGGQRQRVAIARALVTKPDILLGDEPTGNLDSKTTQEVMALFDDLHAEGNTIILVTHEQEIADHCRRVIRLVDGKVTFDKEKSTGVTSNV